MRFADIVGNDRLKEALVSAVDTGRVAHSILFYEDEGCGALALALAFTQYLNCRNRKDGDSCGVCPTCNKISKLIYSDLHFSFPVPNLKENETSGANNFLVKWRDLVINKPYFLESEFYSSLGVEGKSCGIAKAQAVNIIKTLSLSAVERGHKVVLVMFPERLNINAANRLLKIVEEPPTETVFLFITHSPDKVLQTIFSRCQCLRVLPLDKEELTLALESKSGLSQKDARNYANISSGSYGKALSYLSNNDVEDNSFALFSEMMEALINKNHFNALVLADKLGSLDSKEKQKAFCIFVGEALRKIFMVQNNMLDLANIAEDDLQIYLNLANKCKRSFSRKAIDIIDNSTRLLERNVNSKMIFVDMINKMLCITMK